MIDNNRFFVTILRKKKKKIWDFSLISAFQKYIFYMCAFVSTLEKLRKHYVFFFSMYMIAENWKEHGLLN